MGKLFNASFLQRTITGVGVVLGIVFCILGGPFSFLALFTILVGGILWEYYNLINVSKEVHIIKGVHAMGGVILFTCFFCQASHISKLGNNVFVFYMVYLLILFISRLYTKQQNPLREIAYIFMGHIYIALPISLLNSIAFHSVSIQLHDFYQDYNPILLLALFFFLWINDTGAFLAGSLFGKHKLFPSVSPKKTWEGVAGGILLNAAFAVLFSYDRFWTLFGLDLNDLQRYSCAEWIGFGLMVSIFGTYGDLLESFVKRAVGVKDSGNILPGHGGLWDRFDSLILAAPAMMLYLIILAYARTF